ncbi:hypothetical protein [Agrobacterium bohemicum]|uniref:Uncharacterized protein n=1 Tax=Agrobacterium bohemicum TaxID=2052828 RepID=A0A135P864_9HYPH|nr:hypothetical protein [Agrobacterium bohemicum]KXG87610.1 hypothetical protein ATO67_18355 [Agrobacterium bohemicum]
MKLPDINFRNIRKHRSSQNDGFEELTRQLVLADPPENYSSIENRGPGADGGVEIAVKFSDGRVWGWQSKYFPDGFGASEVTQLKKSFRSALTHFPQLERYYVAIPRNLSGSAEGENDTQTKQWINFKKWSQQESNKRGRSVSIELWDETYFVSKLQRNEARYSGMRLYWFDENSFDKQWFENQLSKSRDYIGKRYRPDDHVDVGINKKLQILRRHHSVRDRLTSVSKNLIDASIALRDIMGTGSGAEPLREHCDKIQAEVERILALLQALNVDNLYACDLSECLDDVQTIDRAMPAYQALLQARFERIDVITPKTDETNSVYVYSSAVRSAINDVAGYLRNASLVFSVSDRKILGQPALLVEGDAGAGKSHLVAKEVESHIRDGNPALFIPARTLDHGDRPEQEILRYLDIADIRFETFLAALDSAALAAGGPALLIIDGINESLNAAGWQAGIPALYGQLRKFERLAFCITVRSSYHDLCIRSDVDIPRVFHYGFRGHLGEAAKEYLDRHGIERFSAPVFGLNELLLSPLFLSTAVDFLKSSAQTSFPRGMDSIAKIISFWLKAVEKNLVEKRFDRLSLNDGKISNALNKIAAEMASTGSEYLAYEVAAKLCEDAINLGPPAKESDRFISRLIDEGVLLDSPSRDAESGKRISFGFQKFSDFFVAEAILRDCKTPGQLAEALKNGGTYEYVFSEDRIHEFAGLRVALLALTPILWQVELLDLDDNFMEAVDVSVEDFLASLLWRRGEAITERTVELLESQRKPVHGDEQVIDDTQWFTLLLAMATLPNSPINAAYLKQELASLTLGERDASWSVYLVGKSETYEDDWSVVQQLIDWAWVAPKISVELSKIHLAATALALMTSTTDRQLRDCATKALASLLTKYPEEIPALINEFETWDDAYVRERVLAAASAGVLYCEDKALIKEAAIAVDNMVFTRMPVERHAWTRRYAQIIVDHAVFNSAGIDDKVVARAAPPYASEPIKDWPRLEDVVEQRETARSIFGSVIGFVPARFDGRAPTMAGDFGRYTMGGISSSFSQEVRRGTPPPTREQEISVFWEQVDALGESATALHTEIADVSSLITETRFSDLLASVDPENAGKEDVDSAKDFETRLTELQQELVAKLPEHLRVEFYRIKPLNRYGEKGIRKFSLLEAQYWVFKRTLELGWNRALHENVERESLAFSDGRRDHRVERIGKKYQHIAYGELVGYLADYHWYVNWDQEPTILACLESFQNADIDPTYFSGSYSRPVETFMPDGFVVPPMAFVVDTPKRNMNWTKTLDDIPDLTQYLVQSDPEGTLWAMQRCHCRSQNYMRGFEVEEPFRSAQYGVELILVKRFDLDKLANLTTDEISENNSDVFDHGSTDFHLWAQLSYKHQASPPVLSLEYQAADFQFARPKKAFSPKYTEFDHSGVRDEPDFIAPHPAILGYMKLKPKNGWSSVFVTQDEKPAFADKPNQGDNAACFRLDIIEKFAEDHDLKVAWRVWVEKDGGLGTHRAGPDHKQFARNDYIGYFFRDGDEWQGDLVRFRD